MSVIASVRSEFVKLQHTPYWVIHAIAPLFGAILFTLYFVAYNNVDVYKKLSLIMDLTTMVFPLLISVVVGLNISQEEKASHFQNMLAVPRRRKSLLGKLFILYLSGMSSLTVLYMMFTIGIVIVGTENLPWILLLKAVFGLAFTSLVLYTLHLFLNLKFGLGVSLLCGVFECMQCILYSNIELHGLWRYLPFAWSANWVQDIFNRRLTENSLEWIIIIVMIGCIIFAATFWFAHWEGRKNYE